MAASAVLTRKDELRTQFGAFRQALSNAAHEARSSLIVHRALTLPQIAGANVVHTYWPLVERGEVDTRPLIAVLRNWGVDIVLPVITSFDPDNPTLDHRQYSGPDALGKNKWGIREPVDGRNVPTDTFDAVIVPALGAGRNGHRVGHGSGYYDVFLDGISCPCIALVYDDCFVPSVPHASHDVPVTAVVTERTIYTVPD